MVAPSFQKAVRRWLKRRGSQISGRDMEASLGTGVQGHACSRCSRQRRGTAAACLEARLVRSILPSADIVLWTLSAQGLNIRGFRQPGQTTFTFRRSLRQTAGVGAELAPSPKPQAGRAGKGTGAAPITCP